MSRTFTIRNKEIYLDAPNVGALEKAYLNKAIDAGYVSTIGPFVSEFEERFAEYLGLKKAVSVQSGTEAIHLSLYEFRIGRQDEVIVPALTFVGTVNPILYVGATPIFVDVDVKTWNIDPEGIEKKITKYTKAIIPVHLYGNPCDMARILKIAKRRNLYVIEDATESLGAKYNDKHTGQFGDFGCFSFNGNKIITTGGGGMIVGNDTKRLEHLKFLVNQARDESKGYYHPEIGFNHRMTNVEAALGLAQLRRLDEFLEKKRIFNKIYRKELEGVDSIHFQDTPQGAEGSYWLSCIIFEEGIDIHSLQIELKRKGVITRRVFVPIVEFPPYRIFKGKDSYQVSYDIYNRSLCLPSSTLNSTDDIYRVCRILKNILLKKSR